MNSRDLRTFAVDPDVVRHVRPLVPSDRVFVAESGIADAAGAARARAWGADAILVGEALMRADDPAALTRELSTAAGGPTAAFFAGRGYPFVKLCGLREPERTGAGAKASQAPLKVLPPALKLEAPPVVNVAEGRRAALDVQVRGEAWQGPWQVRVSIDGLPTHLFDGPTGTPAPCEGDSSPPGGTNGQPKPA